MRKPSTPEEVDVILNKLLACQGELDFQRMCVRMRGDLSSEKAIVEMTRWMRRRAIRRIEYSGPSKSDSRFGRSGLPFTWIEKKVMEWAFVKDDCETVAGRVADFEYVAMLLCRTVEEVREFRNVKNGIRSLL